MGQSQSGQTMKSRATMHPLFRLASGGLGTASAAAVPSAVPSTPSTPSTSISSTAPSLGKQESIGMNSIEKPFGGLRGGPSETRRSADFSTDIDLPDTTVGLTPGSEDKEEEDTITAPTINDEEKSREAAEKANDWLS